MNFSKIKKFLKIFKKGIDNLKNTCYNIITVKNTSRAERLISAERQEVMKKYRVFSTLKDVNPTGLELIVEADSEIQAINKAVYIWRRSGFYAYKREIVAELI